MIKDFAGSKLTLKILPLIVLFPIISSYLIIVGIHQNIITIEFGLVANAAVFIPLSIIYLTYIAMGLNKTDEERQQLEIKLREGNRYLKRFKQGVDQVAIVALTDKRGVITYVNDTFCKISQYEKEELIGKTHSIVNAGYHDKKFFANLWKTISSGEIWVDEIKNKAKDGSFYWVLTAIVPFKNEEGDITEFMALRQDVTERKKTEELRLAHLLKLEYKNKELEQFAYVASHDLQEPLRTIINFTDLLSKKKKDHFDEVSLKSLQFIQEATVRMSQLINSLLDYNRIDNDNNLTLVDCNELIHEIEIELSKEIIDTETTIIVQKLPTITGYEPPLKMLFQNLISNAIKFRKEGIKPLIRISAIQNDIGWLFSIKDNGIGISTKHYEKIFVIFQQLHNKNKYEGSGIGLSHCRKIVDLHGGKIWVDSKLNEGSIFNFTISTQSHEKKS
ncbi:ATP-binding protein [uncultured Cyclobacterium sp.]|uniref:sensor histidine kinase n=1 Tax=uncultured Cyclobacterium sp. TaxID=453820 RepID=UPI0030EC8D11